MILSPLVRQLIRSLRREPDRWERRRRNLCRDDGVEIQFVNPFDSKPAPPRLITPREVRFGRVEGLLLRRAITRWQHRPI